MHTIKFNITVYVDSRGRVKHYYIASYIVDDYYQFVCVCVRVCVRACVCVCVCVHVVSSQFIRLYLLTLSDKTFICRLEPLPQLSYNQLPSPCTSCSHTNQVGQHVFSLEH